MSRKLERSKSFRKISENQNRRAYDHGIIMESNEKKNSYRKTNSSNLINLEKDGIIESTEMRVNFTHE